LEVAYFFWGHPVFADNRPDGNRLPYAPNVTVPISFVSKHEYVLGSAARECLASYMQCTVAFKALDWNALFCWKIVISVVYYARWQQYTRKI